MTSICDLRSVLEALQGRERWQPEFPEFESDTMGRSFTENKERPLRSLLIFDRFNQHEQLEDEYDE